MPIAVSGIFVAGGLIGAEADEPASTILLLALAFVAAGLHVPRSRAAAGLASVLAAIVLLSAVSAASGELVDVVLDLAFVVPWAVGVAFGETLARARSLAAEAERARVEQELEAERGAAAERRRIARELHDVLANSLSVMIVQASLAAELVAVDPAAAVAAVGEVERSGRAALGETGRLLRIINIGADDVTDASAARSGRPSSARRRIRARGSRNRPRGRRRRWPGFRWASSSRPTGSCRRR